MEIIKLQLDDENTLYNPFDDELLSDDVRSYLIDRVSLIEHDVSLKIICEKPIDEERFRKVLRFALEEREKQLLDEGKRNFIHQLIMLAIGVVCLMLWLVLSAKEDNVSVQILSILASFAVWEAADVWLVDTPDNSRHLLHVRMLRSADVIFEYGKKDDVLNLDQYEE